MKRHQSPVVRIVTLAAIALSALMLVALVLSGCGPQPTATPTATKTPTSPPQSTPTPSATPTTVATSTTAPTPEPTATNTPLPEPTATHTPTPVPLPTEWLTWGEAFYNIAPEVVLVGAIFGAGYALAWWSRGREVSVLREWLDFIRTHLGGRS